MTNFPSGIVTFLFTVIEGSAGLMQEKTHRTGWRCPRPDLVYLDGNLFARI